jgi:hypothetical protein
MVFPSDIKLVRRDCPDIRGVGVITLRLSARNVSDIKLVRRDCLDIRGVGVITLRLSARNVMHWQELFGFSYMFMRLIPSQ